MKYKIYRKTDFLYKLNTPGTAGGPGGLDWTLAIYLLVMPKYCGENYFAHWSLSQVDQKQKTEREEEERPNDGNNNAQLRTAGGAHKAAWVKSIKHTVIWK